MAQQLVKNRKISDDIVERLEQMILEGIFATGTRLPAERKLAEQFGVSRPSLREALKKLAAKGLITSKQGGGNYVAEGVGQLFKDPILNLYEEYPDAQRDLLEFRHTLEASSAYYAAQRATALDLERLKKAFESIEKRYLDKNSTQQQEAEADANFHLVIAETSHNMVLLQIMRMLCDLVKQNIITSIFGLHAYSTEARDSLMEQHRALYEAIKNGDPEQAKLAASTHIDYVRTVWDEMAQEQKRMAQSARRERLSQKQ
ncbi:GntR family transcriptional regulator [Entomomonas sp. E2T0]|uniref:FCD domain-containing protein n=1 Tax=Entomomonas sp. E2T0 TaxID=2930213 RepID=UPI0022283F82|nr:GntR family transcriptional regulator [Entomomonas sp. E2T0]UYZ83866.1 GntR family transcriptional regulator [Entomomonas sp. E2T0]